MVRAVCLALWLGACTFDPSGIGAGDDAGPGADSGPACEWLSPNLNPCSLPDPGMRLSLSGGTFRYDTDSGDLTDPQDQLVDHVDTVFTGMTPEVLVLVADGFTLGQGAQLDVFGSRPAVIVSWTDIDIRGDLDLGSSSGGLRGAGSNPPECAVSGGGARGVDRDGGASGGGGAGFGGTGGTGGDGDLDGPPASIGGAGGNTVAVSSPRGGCDGGRGGDDTRAVGGGSGGVGGEGGGAILLIARNQVRVRERGRIDARAGGGRGGTTIDGGGGGGGAGGYIGLDAPMIVLRDDGEVFANGGGGGGGAGTQDGLIGQDGQSAIGSAAGGVAPASQGTDGGDGGALVEEDGRSVTDLQNGGGGGGGGGAGIVLYWGNLSIEDNAYVSPQETLGD